MKVFIFNNQAQLSSEAIINKVFFYLGIQNPQYEKSAFGKLYLTNYPLYFNISNSHLFWVIAVDQKEIGIDIEKIVNREHKIINIAQRYFHYEEIQYLKENHSQKSFYKLWTRKESYSKKIGLGFHYDFSNFSLIQNQRFVDCLEINHEIIYFLSFFYDEYCLSICASQRIELEIHWIS